jgi:Zn-finger nucleic acid-binding protein
VPLVARKTGVLGYAECSRCAGLFLSNEVFEAVTEEADARTTARAVEGEKPSGPEKAPQSFHYRKCPSCSGLMARRNYGAGSGVILDICGKHGIFLDRGELTAVVGFLEKGGWERVKKREREKLQEEIASLEARKRLASLPGGPFPSADGMSGGLPALVEWIASVLGRPVR